MKASEVIERLQELIKEHGDLVVNYNLEGKDASVLSIEFYDDSGNDSGEIVEFYIH